MIKLKKDAKKLIIPANVGNVSSEDENAYENGYNEGHNSGYEEGYSIGNKEGYDNGLNDGLNNAVELLKVTPTKISFEGYTGTEFKNLKSIDFSNCTDLSSMFKRCNNIVEFDIPNDILNLKTDGTEYSFQEMFSHCDNLKKINMDFLRDVTVTNISNLFSYSKKLEEIDNISFKMPKDKTCKIESLCGGCYNLKHINLDFLRGVKVKGISTIFDYCFALEEIDLSYIDLTEVENLSCSVCFRYLQSCKTINFSGCNFIKYDGYSYGIYDNWYGYTENLENIITDENTRFYDYDWTSFSTFTGLTRESMLNVFNALPTTQRNSTINLNREHQIPKLQDGDIQILIDKGWNVQY